MKIAISLNSAKKAYTRVHFPYVSELANLKKKISLAGKYGNDSVQFSFSGPSNAFVICAILDASGIVYTTSDAWKVETHGKAYSVARSVEISIVSRPESKKLNLEQVEAEAASILEAISRAEAATV